MGRCFYEKCFHLIMRDKVGALIFKLLVLDMDVRAPTLSLIVMWEISLIRASLFKINVIIPFYFKTSPFKMNVITPLSSVAIIGKFIGYWTKPGVYL